MLCKKPFLQGPLPFGCGQCNPCRIKRRRLWSHRMLLESYCHEHSSFLTLTYNPQSLPAGNTLDPRHTQLFLKRLRKAMHPRKLRYFLVGEYGDVSQRPHYHAALFGVSRSEDQIVQDAWKKGFTYLGDLTHESAQYIAGYVTKKMTSKDDLRLNGRHPEYARMSRKPGLGALFIPRIEEALTTEAGANELIKTGDIPQLLQHGQKKLPLGRYLRSKLRERMGFHETGTPKENLALWAQEMSQLLEGLTSSPTHKNKKLDQILVDENKQKVMNLESKQKIFSKKGAL